MRLNVWYTPPAPVSTGAIQRCHFVSRTALTPAQGDRMFALFARCFSGVDRELFERDLVSKNWVILLEDDAGNLRGFSTLLLNRTHYDGEPISIVYSGDTIVAPGSWGTSALPRTWIDSVWSLHRPGRDGRLLWLLLTSGFRTYRFLPLFWREFFPRFDRPTPEGLQRLVDALAAERFGRCYDPEAGEVDEAEPDLEESEGDGPGKEDPP